MILQGNAVCLGADIDTDVIIAGRYLRTKDRRVWATRVFEDLDPALAARMEGAVIIAGPNFGCGSSREQAPIALKEAGVVGVIAPGFARIFFRNAINVGLPVVECEAVRCREAAPVSFSPEGGWVEVDGVRYAATPLSGHMLEILRHGGLVEYWRRQQ